MEVPEGATMVRVQLSLPSRRNQRPEMTQQRRNLTLRRHLERVLKAKLMETMSLSSQFLMLLLRIKMGRERRRRNLLLQQKKRRLAWESLVIPTSNLDL